MSMSNILAFPSGRFTGISSGSFIDAAHILAYCERHAVQQPQRVLDLSVQLQLANKTAELLQNLLESIRFELDRAEAEDRQA